MTFYKEDSPSLAGHMVRCCFLLTFVFLAGCASVRGFPEQIYNEEEEIKKLQAYYAPAQIDAYVKATDPEKKRIRDEFVLASMRAMDIKFNQFLQVLRWENIPTKTAVAWARTGVSTAGGLIAGFSSQILSGVAAGLEATQAPVSEHVFYEKTMPVLFGQMEASRKVVKARILTGLSQPVSVYPLPKALIDLADYYLAGSIPGALINIAAASGAASSEAEQKIERLVPLTPQQSAQSVAIGLAIQELQDRDLDKINKAIETLNVVLKKSVEPSNDFKTAKQRLIEMWKKTEFTPENIKIFTDVLQGVGILPK